MALRNIVKTVQASYDGHIYRLLGSVDCKGQGIKHELESLDPLIMIDYANVQGKGVPPFGMHPHAGLIANTFVLQGSFYDEDNLNGRSDHLNEAGDVYVVSAGRGVAHAEATATEGAHKAVQIICKIPDAMVDLPPEICKVKAADLPVLALPGGQIKILTGQLGDKAGATIAAYPQCVMGRAWVNPGSSIEIPLEEAKFQHGVVFALSGSGSVVDDETSTLIDESMQVVVFGQGHNLKLKNQSDTEELEAFFIGCSPLNEEWVKLKGFNGFFLAPTKAEAEKIYSKIEEVGGKNFTYKVWEATE